MKFGWLLTSRQWMPAVIQCQFSSYRLSFENFLLKSSEYLLKFLLLFLSFFSIYLARVHSVRYLGHPLTTEFTPNDSVVLPCNHRVHTGGIRVHLGQSLDPSWSCEEGYVKQFMNESFAFLLALITESMLRGDEIIVQRPFRLGIPLP